MQLYVGCPIWSFKGWVGNFYPRGTKPADFLRQYSHRLTAIEGNTIFYAVPGPEKLAQWISQTPTTFQFCPKVPRTISHTGQLAQRIQEAFRFVDVMRQLGDRLGPMFLQLPPGYSPDMFDDLKAFLDAWPSEVRLGVELRHLAWFEPSHNDTINELLMERKMARVVIDTRPIRSLAGDKILDGSVYQTLLEARQRKPDVPIIQKSTADFYFLRYIGHPQMEVNTPLLDEWGSYLASELRHGADVYVFCHSPDNILEPMLCREIHKRIAAEVHIPPLPWDEIRQDAFDQGQLF